MKVFYAAVIAIRYVSIFDGKEYETAMTLRKMYKSEQECRSYAESLVKEWNLENPKRQNSVKDIICMFFEG